MQELLIIEPGRTEKNYWSDLWRYRDLLYILAWRDISVLYKQTAIGVVWAILRPLLAMVIFTVVFGRIVKMPFDDTPYPEASKMKRPIPLFPRASARGLWLTTIAIALVFGGSAPNCWSGPSGQTSEIPVLTSDPWQANELIKPEELARWLPETSGAKPFGDLCGISSSLPRRPYRGSKIRRTDGKTGRYPGAETCSEWAFARQADRSLLRVLSVG
jgi:hypothetical protein